MTQEMTPMPLQAHRRRPVVARPPVEIGAASAAGARGANEDQIAIATSRGQVASPALKIAAPAASRACRALAVVADGMTGPGHGALASRMVVQRVLSGLTASLAHGEGVDDAGAALADRLQEAQRQLLAVATASRIHPGFGSTATVAWVDGPTLTVAHVGDSRAYLWRQGSLQKLTSDHTMAERLRGAGVESPPRRFEHVLWNAVTAHAPPHVELRVEALVEGDVLLLCTDGLYDVLTEAQLARPLARAPSAAARELVETARRAGATDDATAGVLRFARP